MAKKEPALLYRVEFVCSKGVRREDVQWRRGRITTHADILAMQQQIEKETGLVSIVLLNWSLLADTTHGARHGVAQQAVNSLQNPRLLPFTQTED